MIAAPTAAAALPYRHLDGTFARDAEGYGTRYVNRTGRYGIRSVDVRREDGQVDTVTFDHCIIAAGASPKLLPGTQRSQNVVTYEEQILAEGEEKRRGAGRRTDSHASGRRGTDPFLQMVGRRSV